MTEPANKKSKEGRYYRVESNIAEVDPVIEPLTDLDDDEDAIDRLLINTGFDAEEDISLFSAAQTKSLFIPQDPIPQFTAFGDDEMLSALETEDHEAIEPVEIGSPIADVEPDPALQRHENTSVSDDPICEQDYPVSVDDDHQFSAFRNSTTELTTSLHDAFASPSPGTRDPIEPVAPGSPALDIDLNEAILSGSASSEDHDELIEQEPEPDIILPVHADEAPVITCSALSSKSPDENIPKVDTPYPGKGITVDASASPYDPGLLLSMPEETRQQMARLEARAKNAGRLSYAAIALSLAALSAALTVGYLNLQTRTELTKLKTMQSIIQEDMSGLNEKLDSDNQPAEEGAEKSSYLSDDSKAPPEYRSTAVGAPSPAETEVIQARATPAQVTAGNHPAERSVRKTQALPAKPAMKTTLPKSSKGYEAKPAAGGADGHWSVNLASFREIEDARKKAAEFRQKGVAVQVTKIGIKHANWYRLSVPGFKTKEAASTHSTRLKKLLRLSSIWVAAI
ncbi:MAG: SPOR domain-containing protein [Methylomicrobium sp.]